MIPRGQPNPPAAAGASPKRVRVRYFAQLREQAGCAEEQVETLAATPGGLYEELRDRYRFTLPAGRLQAAVNDDFAPWDAPLADGGSVAFIPPFAGG